MKTTGPAGFALLTLAAFALAPGATTRAETPEETARAFLTAYRARDFEAMTPLATSGNRRIIAELQAQGEAHPRYRSLFTGPNWETIQSWDGQVDRARFRAADKAIVPFGPVSESGRRHAVMMALRDGRWLMDDIRTVDRDELQRLHTDPPPPEPAPPPPPPDAAGGGTGGATQGLWRFRTERCLDEERVLGDEVCRMLVPAGWRFAGRVRWILCPSMPAVVELSVTSPDGAAQLSLIPNSVHFWTERGMPRLTHPIGSKYFGREVLPVMEAPRYLREVWIPRNRADRPGLRMARVEEAPALAAVYQERCMPFATAQGARATIEYVLDDVPMEEEIYLLLYYWNLPVGQATFVNWGSDFQVAFRAPKGQMDRHARLFKVMAHSVRVDRGWYNRYAQLVELLIRANIDHIISVSELGRYIARIGSEMREDNLRAWYGRQAVNDRLVNSFSHHILGVEQYGDPHGGPPLLLPAGADNAWINGNGDVVLSESPSFNPNIGSNQSWQPISRQP